MKLDKTFDRGCWGSEKQYGCLFKINNYYEESDELTKHKLASVMNKINSLTNRVKQVLDKELQTILVQTIKSRYKSNLAKSNFPLEIQTRIHNYLVAKIKIKQ